MSLSPHKSLKLWMKIKIKLHDSLKILTFNFKSSIDKLVKKRRYKHEDVCIDCYIL